MTYAELTVVLASVGLRLWLLLAGLMLGTAVYADDKVSLVLSECACGSGTRLTASCRGNPSCCRTARIAGPVSVDLRQVSTARAVLAVADLVRSAGFGSCNVAAWC